MHITIFHMYTQPNKCMGVTHGIFWISRLEAEFFYERDPNVLLQSTKLVTSARLQLCGICLVCHGNHTKLLKEVTEVITACFVTTMYFGSLCLGALYMLQCSSFDLIYHVEFVDSQRRPDMLDLSSLRSLIGVPFE